MNRQHVAFLLVLAAGSSVLPATARETDPPIRSGTSRSDCICPKEGHWNVQNLEGWMDCTGPMNFKRKLEPEPDRGTIWVLAEDCNNLFGEASRKKDEDVEMIRGEDCKYAGVISGKDQGVDMVIDVTWSFESEEALTGEMWSKPSMQGMTCEYYRPFEIKFREPLPADKEPKLREQMEKKLATFRAKSG